MNFRALPHLAVLTILFGCAATAPLKQDFVEALTDDAIAGKSLFQANGCVRCHGLDGRGETHYSMFLYNGPPDLRDLDAYHRGTEPEDIAETILTGVPGTWMPAYKLTLEERMKIAAYVTALQDDAPDEVVEEEPKPKATPPEKGPATKPAHPAENSPPAAKK